MVKAKRVYEKPSKDDGKRILVDRLWPRGLSREAAAVDDWIKEIAPSNELRKWFGHDPARWPEFRKRYRAEIGSNQGLIEKLRVESRKGTVTLLYAARDMERNNAVVLKEMFD
jgi:uncharacterized protein YeaO (DUF488 family)